MKPMNLDAWLRLRIADVARREGQHSLDTVGPEKPLGSQGFSSIAAAEAAIDRNEPRARAMNRNLRFSADASSMPVWVYLWDVEALSAHLASAPGRALAASMGGRADLPLTADAFVEFLRKPSSVKPHTPRWDFISDAFGDHTNPGRTDVLKAVTGFNLAVALDLYDRRAGFPDPVTIFIATSADPSSARTRARKLLRKYGFGGQS